MSLSPRGKPAQQQMLVNVPRLVAAYYNEKAGPGNARE